MGENSNAPTKTADNLAPARPCAIKNIHPGMTVGEVRRKLSGYKMEYRGERQDENIYYVSTGGCDAFLEFNYGDGRLDVVGYEGGSGVDEYRDTVAHKYDSFLAPSKPSPAPNKGFPIPESMFVNAYVLANHGREDLDDDQLAQLAKDEYAMGRDLDTQMLMLGGEVLSTRGNRALHYIEAMRRTQPQ
jgi:hypothetical protein